MRASLKEVRAAIKEGDHARALQLIAPLLHSNPDAEVWYLAARLAKTDAEAVRCLNRALSLNPRHADALTMLAMLGGSRQGITKTITSELAAMVTQSGDSVFFRNVPPKRRAILLGALTALLVLAFAVVITAMARPGSVTVASQGPTPAPVQLLSADAILAQLSLDEFPDARLERADEGQKHIIRLALQDEEARQTVEIWVYPSIAALIEDRAALDARESADRVRSLANAVLIYPQQLSAQYASRLEFAFNAFQSSS